MIKDPALLTIRRNFRRPNANLISRLKAAQTGHVIDAMEGRGALDHRIKPIDPNNAHFAGVALTCETFANDNLAVLAALALAQPGDVIVVASDGFARTAVIGDIIAMMAKNKGVAAIVVDGMARDLDGILAAGLAVFARGITPNSCVKNGPGNVGLPIVAGGVAIDPGDVIVGDRDGAVVVPQAELEGVVAALEEIRQLEAELQCKIRTGLTHPESILQLLQSDRVRYVD